jgi:hypothetical protein
MLDFLGPKEPPPKQSVTPPSIWPARSFLEGFFAQLKSPVNKPLKPAFSPSIKAECKICTFAKRIAPKNRLGNFCLVPLFDKNHPSSLTTSDNSARFSSSEMSEAESSMFTGLTLTDIDFGGIIQASQNLAELWVV